MLQVEDFDESVDPDFIKMYLTPYLRDLYKDLQMRSSTANIDKVTFIEYTKLPGIINDRLHVMFSDYKQKNEKNITLEDKKNQDFVTDSSFLKNFTTIFIGNLDAKIKFTFEM